MRRPPRICSHPGCSALTSSQDGRCPRHPRQPFAELRGPEQRRAYNRDQPESNRFYKTAAWQRVRVAILSRRPLCVECERLGRVTAATLVDHIIPYRERPDLGLDQSNLRPLCHFCHGRIGQRVTATDHRRPEGEGGAPNFHPHNHWKMDGS
ncbi:MAG: HNH endonuclease [Dokdonella sp.]|nr:HNH endonuclease [Dokdonella sp.]